MNTSITHTLQAKISVVGILDSLIEDALNCRASDLHIDPEEDRVRVRIRIDGLLNDKKSLPSSIHSELISRIKILSKLRTDEHHKTQDGRFRHVTLSNNHADIRVSIIPTYHGENAVLRILQDTTSVSGLSSLGFSKRDETLIREAIRKPSGMILATGPTGSGKTTTLYTLVKELHRKEISIVTIEDPIEYAITGIEQIQTHDRTGLTFANGLRSILRQDPNVIMVGEIRDQETAQISVNAALTGHLLLSTLHTSDAPTTLPRLLDMGVEPFLLASTLSLAIAQRLVRKLCPFCKASIALTAALEETILRSSTVSLKELSFFKAVGCAKCKDGYHGRISVNEVLAMDEEIRNAILAKASARDIQKVALRNGMKTIFDDALLKASEGLTTLEEAFRIAHD